MYALSFASQTPHASLPRKAGNLDVQFSWLHVAHGCSYDTITGNLTKNQLAREVTEVT